MRTRLTSQRTIGEILPRGGATSVGYIFLPLGEKASKLPRFREKKETRSAVCLKNGRFTKRPFNSREKLPFGWEKWPLGLVKLPLRFGKRPPAMLNLQKCCFAKKRAVSMKNIASNRTAERSTRRKATGMYIWAAGLVWLSWYLPVGWLCSRET